MTHANRAQLREIFEHCMFLMPETPDIRRLQIPGVRGRSSSVSHPLVNLVGAAQLSDAEADDTIARLLDHFGPAHAAFGWLVGPLSQPTDLRHRLTAAGFVPAEQLQCLALDDLTALPPRDDALRIRRAEQADLEPVARLLADAYPLPRDAADVLARALLPDGHEDAPASTLAFAEGLERPVAIGTSVKIPGHPVVLLAGAATLASHRRRGAYRTLLAHRLEQAAAAGIETAIIQASATTSAPICKRLGFEEVCTMDVYAYLP